MIAIQVKIVQQFSSTLGCPAAESCRRSRETGSSAAGTTWRLVNLVSDILSLDSELFAFSVFSPQKQVCNFEVIFGA